MAANHRWLSMCTQLSPLNCRKWAPVQLSSVEFESPRTSMELNCLEDISVTLLPNYSRSVPAPLRDFSLTSELANWKALTFLPDGFLHCFASLPAFRQNCHRQSASCTNLAYSLLMGDENTRHEVRGFHIVDSQLLELSYCTYISIAQVTQHNAYQRLAQQRHLEFASGSQ